MKSPAPLFLLCLLFTAFSLPLAAQQPTEAVPPLQESEWLTPTAGEQERSLGARIERVTPAGEDGSVAVEISLPPREDEIEEIVIYGRPDQVTEETPIIEIEQSRPFEVYSSPEKSGIVIYLPRLQGFVLRINYYEEPSDVIPDRVRER